MDYILVLTAKPDDLQETLNRRSAEGWRVHTYKSHLVASFWGSARIQFSVLLEREKTWKHPNAR